VTERRVVILQHQDAVSAGYLDEVLEEAGLSARVIRVDRGEAPEPGTYEAVVVLGGEMGAYEEADHPFLAMEKAYLAAEAGRGTPVLGICLGSQLLADALGGRAFAGGRSEIGYEPVELTDEGRHDAVLRHLDGPVLSWHADTFDVPPGARVLAASASYPQAYRVGDVLGLQFHPEASPEMVANWVEAVGPDRIREAGADPEALVEEARRRADECRAAGRRVLEAWAGQVADGSTGRSGGSG
jgi:GMP synthase (glutamine-hydrolysing)